MGIRKDKSQLSADDLRRYAEKKLQESKSGPQPPQTCEESQRLVHELQVHQIELEIQNEELWQTRTALETALDQITDIYEFAPVGYPSRIPV